MCHLTKKHCLTLVFSSTSLSQSEVVLMRVCLCSLQRYFRSACLCVCGYMSNKACRPYTRAGGEGGQRCDLCVCVDWGGGWCCLQGATRRVKILHRHSILHLLLLLHPDSFVLYFFHSTVLFFLLHFHMCSPHLHDPTFHFSFPFLCLPALPLSMSLRCHPARS